MIRPDFRYILTILIAAFLQGAIFPVELFSNPRTISQDTTEIYASFCSGGFFGYNGEFYTEPGTYPNIFSTAGGDSIVLLHLEEIPPVYGEFHIDYCLGDINPEDGLPFEFLGSFSHTEVLSAVSGCDSIVTVITTIHNFGYEETTIEIDEGSIYHGVEIHQDTTFHFSDTTEYGCDKLIVEHVNVVVTGVEETVRQPEILAFLNPFSEDLRVEVTTSGALKSELKIYNSLGHKIPIRMEQLKYSDTWV